MVVNQTSVVYTLGSGVLMLSQHKFYLFQKKEILHKETLDPWMAFLDEVRWESLTRQLAGKRFLGSRNRRKVSKELLLFSFA